MSDVVPPSQAVEVFISYTHKDRRLKDRLLPHLALLQRQEVITAWHDADISAGRGWRAEIEAHLNSARIILLLISADFLASDFCYDQEMTRAMERHETGSARVIPVFLRECDWRGAPFGRLQGVPSDARPVSRWPDKDEAFTQIAQAIRKVAEEIAPNLSRENEAIIAKYLRTFLKETQTLIDQLLSLAAQETASAVAPPERILSDITVPPLLLARRQTSSVASPGEIFNSFPLAFKSLGQRVLLLGVPGAGKTTTLLQFACTAAQARLDDPSRPIPLFASLHRWDHQMPLPQWVQARLQNKFPGISLQDQSLLYLLDGLDELGGERPVDPERPEEEKYDPRLRLLAALAEQLPEVPVVISCREQEYEQLGEKAMLRGAVTLLPLSPEQIEDFLRAQNQAALWEVVVADASLLELARTPLLLALLSSAVGEAPGEVRLDLGSPTIHTLFDFYIKQRFLHEGQKRPLPFDEPTTRRKLSRLAAYMWGHSWSPAAEMSFQEVEAVIGEQGQELAMDFLALLLAVDLRRQEPDGSNASGSIAQEFVAFACSMQFLRQVGSDAIQFIHLKFRDYCAVTALVEAFRDEAFRDGDRYSYVYVRSWAVKALVEIGQPAVPALVKVLRDEDSYVRWSAVLLLEKIRDATAVPALVEALRDEDSYVRWSAAWALKEIGQPAVDALMEALRDEDSYVRWSAAWALKEIGQPAVDALMEALQDEDGYVRGSIAETLGRIGQRN